MSQIYISQEYFAVMKKISSITKVKSAVIFKGKDENGQYTGKYYFNIPTKQLLINISATENDIKFDGDQLQISSVGEFIKFAESVGYPKCSIEMSREISVRGRPFDNFVFSGNNKTARLSVSDISAFTADKNHFKICRPRESDPMRYLAKMGFTPDSMSALVKDIKMVSSCLTIALNIVGDKCDILIRGKGNQQVTYTLDEMCFKVMNDSQLAVAYGDPKKTRLFPAVMFRLLDGLDSESEVEVRHVKSPMNDIVTLKGYCSKQGAVIPGSEDGKNSVHSEILFTLVAVESSSSSIVNVDYIV